METNVPPTTEFSEPFWEMARRGTLGLQRCGACGGWTFPARVLCPRCWSTDLTWAPASGRATLYSYTTVCRPPSPEFAGDVPYTVALVALEEGPRMMARLAGVAEADTVIGMPLEVEFDPESVVPLPRFVAAR
jgi:uncharacterized OB-fold protein